MKSIMERWIRACRHKLLDRTLNFNQADLLAALREYQRRLTEHRLHRGIANADHCGHCPTRSPNLPR